MEQVKDAGRADRIAELLDAIRREVVAELAGEPDSDVQSESASGLMPLARALDQVGRVGHGLLLQVLGRLDQARAVPGGIGPWLTSQLGYPPGRARALAHDARKLGPLPEVTEQLSSGSLPVGASRVLARAARAATTTREDPASVVADTLSTLRRDGIQAAERQVRVLEHTLNPAHGEQQRARQRAASFARIAECESGMARIDVLLDAERAALLRTALDLLVSAWLRARQYDRINPLPDDVHTTEQLTAEALVRLAEVFLNATEAQRASRFAPTVLYYAPEPEPLQDPAAPEPTPTPHLRPIPPGSVETGYGDLIPAPVRESAALHLTFTADGHPATLDGQPLDQDPTSRLASPAQRLALAFRDRHCTYSGCTRPISWSLHAHHDIAYADGGPTTIRNLTLYCAEHHVLTHQNDAA